MLERFDIEKAKAVMLYISCNIQNRDIMRLFKILYFAEKKHLAKWGDFILNDRYIAMRNGPVRSMLYDLFKGIRGDGLRSKEFEMFYNAFKIDGKYNVTPLETPDMDYLSQSNITFLNQSIEENKDINFNKLSKNSHDTAWKSADRNEIIDFIDIAKAGGASKEMVDYIVEERELSEILGCV
jgi:uncharacterized phage-associated protein